MFRSLRGAKSQDEFNVALRPQRPYGLLQNNEPQEGHLDFHTAPKLCTGRLLNHKSGRERSAEARNRTDVVPRTSSLNAITARPKSARWCCTWLAECCFTSTETVG